MKIYMDIDKYRVEKENNRESLKSTDIKRRKWTNGK